MAQSMQQHNNEAAGPLLSKHLSLRTGPIDWQPALTLRLTVASPFSSLSQIIPALQSRCTRFRFGPLETEQVRNRLQFVIKQEK